MLSFVCDKKIQDDVIEFFVKKFCKIVKDTELKTLAFDYFDDDLEDEVEGLIYPTSDGFDFDTSDDIGEEPYGYVTPFFESFLYLIEKVKKEFPSIGIDGYIFVNDLGCAEYVCRQGVYTTKDMKDVSFFDQLQCVVCHKWINAKDAYKTIMEDEIDFDVNDGNSEEWLYPSGYHNNGTEGEFCICSEECNEKISED